MKRFFTGIALALCLGGCVTQDATQTPTALDADRYELEVQPFVERSCASLDCHGDLGRPLRLYSELGLRSRDALRLSPVDDATDPTPITAGELRANVAAFAALLPPLSAGDELLPLSKPLSLAAGGGHHVGGPLFDDEEHPGYLCLRRWIEGLDDAEDADSCFAALALLSP